MKRKEILVVLILALVLVSCVILDIYIDLSGGEPLGETLSLELPILLSALAIVTCIGISYRKSYFHFNLQLNKSNADLNYWKSKSKHLVEGLASSIDDQLNSWKLTSSEKDVALLLIKGYSTKEISEFRESAEKTIRVHSTAIYKKSNLGGRHELTAFFLEDLLLPSENPSENLNVK